MGTFVVPKIYHELTFSNFNSGDCDMFVNQRFFFKVWLLKNENALYVRRGVGVGVKNRTVLNCNVHTPTPSCIIGQLSPLFKRFTGFKISSFFLIVQEHIKVI